MFCFPLLVLPCPHAHQDARVGIARIGGLPRAVREQALDSSLHDLPSPRLAAQGMPTSTRSGALLLRALARGSPWGSAALARPRAWTPWARATVLGSLLPGRTRLRARGPRVDQLPLSALPTVVIPPGWRVGVPRRRPPWLGRVLYLHLWDLVVVTRCSWWFGFRPHLTATPSSVLADPNSNSKLCRRCWRGLTSIPAEGSSSGSD